MFSTEHGTIGVVAILIVSMFLGFLFQSFTKIFRTVFIDWLIMKWIEMTNEKLLNQVINELKAIDEFKYKAYNNINIIHTIHNYLFTQYDQKMVPEFIMPRLALWSNMFFVFAWVINFLLLAPFFNIIPVSLSGFMPFDILLLIVFMILSLITYVSYHYGYYDSLLRTFITSRLLVSKK